MMGKISYASLALIVVSASLNGGITDVTSDAELNSTLSGSKKPVVIMAHMERCGHCKKAMPHVRDLADKYTDVDFILVELGNAPKFAGDEQIMGAPTFLFYEAGSTKPMNKIVGANMQLLEEKVKSLSGKAPMMQAPKKKEFKKPMHKKKQKKETAEKKKPVRKKKGMKKEYKMHRHEKQPTQREEMRQVTGTECPACRTCKHREEHHIHHKCVDGACPTTCERCK